MTRRLTLVLAALVALACAPTALGAAAKGPDLVAGSVKGKPKQVVAGARFTVKVTIKNTGNRKAGKSTLALYLAPRSRHSSGDLRIGRAKVRALNPHRSQTVKVKAQLPAVKASARALKPGSYRVIACADATHKVKERNEKNDCRVASGAPLKLVAPTSNRTPPSTSAPGPTHTGAPAFAMADGFDWGFAQDADRNGLTAGEPIDITLRAANGFPGQAGYTRTLASHQDVPSGTTTNVPVSENDDGFANVTLPFAFPFAGIPYDTVSVSTNGWVGFNPPAFEYGSDSTVVSDFRGEQTVIGRFFRGLMPYWTDLDLDSATSPSLTETVAPGDASVTFAWDIGECCDPNPANEAQRSFSVTLFPDGTFRYDYGTSSGAGSNTRFVGYSAGNGSLDDFADTGTSEPSSSLLYTPKPLAGTGTLPAGTMTASIPRGTTAGSLDPGCSVTQPATALQAGLITCTVPALAAGSSVVRNVAWRESSDEMTSEMPTRDYSGAYVPAGLPQRTDEDELVGVAGFNANQPVSTSVTYASGASPVAGDPMQFKVHPSTAGGTLLNPAVTITLPTNATLDSIQVDGQSHDYASCEPPSGGTVTCLLPSAVSWGTLDVNVTPGAAAVGNPVTVSAVTHADNEGTVAPGQASSPNVGA